MSYTDTSKQRKQAKRHHFVPRMHLQHFIGNDPQGHVWTYDAKMASCRSSVPEETAFETHFYSAENLDGTMDTTIEDFLAQMESDAAPVYVKLLEGRLPETEAERADFAVFLALMYLRTPTQRRISAEMISRTSQIMNYAYATHDGAFDTLVRRMAESGGPVIDDDLKDEVRRTMLDSTGYTYEIPKERTFHVFGASGKLAQLFFEMNWSFAVPLQGFLITSDNPLVKQIEQKSWSPVYGDGGFINKTVRVSFPLSPKLMLILSWDKSLPEFGGLVREHVDELNRARASHSERYLYAHLRHKRLSKLAAEFKDVRPSMTTKGFGPKRFADFRVLRRSTKNG